MYNRHLVGGDQVSTRVQMRLRAYSPYGSFITPLHPIVTGHTCANFQAQQNRIAYGCGIPHLILVRRTLAVKATVVNLYFKTLINKAINIHTKAVA